MIRKAEVKDLSYICKAHIASIMHFCAESYTKDQIDSWTSILTPSIYESALLEKEFIVACDEHDTVQGLGILDISNEEICAVYVHPQHSWKGVGSELLNALEEIARQSRLETLHLCSTLNAKGFYSDKGYKTLAMSAHPLPNGLKLDCVKMVKTFEL